VGFSDPCLPNARGWVPLQSKGSPSSTQGPTVRKALTVAIPIGVNRKLNFENRRSPMTHRKSSIDNQQSAIDNLKSAIAPLALQLLDKLVRATE
jgi:hypothetical protein